MGSGCIKENNNVYFRARKEAAMYNERLFSREGAAELLGISVSTLADYELGNTKVVPVDKVVLMADLYNCPQLKAGYCKRECPIGKSAPISTEVVGIEGAALRLIKELNAESLKELKEQIIEIAADGKITDDEKAGLRKIVKSLNDISYAISEITLLAEKELGEMVNT